MYIFTPQDFYLYISLFLFFSLSSLIFFRFLSCNSHFIFFLSLFPYSSPVFSIFHTHSLFSLHCFCFLIYFNLSSFISLFFFFVYISFNSIYFVSWHCYNRKILRWCAVKHPIYLSIYLFCFTLFLFFLCSFFIFFILFFFLFLFFFVSFCFTCLLFYFFLFCVSFYFLLLSFLSFLFSFSFFLSFLFSFTLLFFLTFDCFLSIYLSPSFHFLTTWAI